jgi:hypothetical protein
MIDVLDLDYTLLDTEEFKNDLSVALRMTRSEYDHDYVLYFTSQGRNYNVDDHLSYRIRDGYISDIEAKKSRDNVSKLLLHIDHYLKEGTEELLGELKKRGDKLFLFTFGNNEWQKRKVLNSKILKKYFDRYFFEEGDKASNKDLLELAMSNEEMLIVNDNLKEGLEMIKTLKVFNDRSRLVIINGKYSQDETARKVLGDDYEMKMESLGIRRFDTLNQISEQMHPDGEKHIRPEQKIQMH